MRRPRPNNRPEPWRPPVGRPLALICGQNEEEERGTLEHSARTGDREATARKGPAGDDGGADRRRPQEPDQDGVPGSPGGGGPRARVGGGGRAGGSPAAALP